MTASHIPRSMGAGAGGGSPRPLRRPRTTVRAFSWPSRIARTWTESPGFLAWMHRTSSSALRTTSPSKAITTSPDRSPASCAAPPWSTALRRTPTPGGTPRTGRSPGPRSLVPIPITASRDSRRSMPRSQTERKFSSASRQGPASSASGSETETLVSAPDSLTRSTSIRASSPRRVGRRTSRRPSSTLSTVVSSRIPFVARTMYAPPTRRSISIASPSQ